MVLIEISCAIDMLYIYEIHLFCAPRGSKSKRAHDYCSLFEKYTHWHAHRAGCQTYGTGIDEATTDICLFLYYVRHEAVIDHNGRTSTPRCRFYWSIFVYVGALHSRLSWREFADASLCATSCTRSNIIIAGTAHHSIAFDQCTCAICRCQCSR